MRIFTFLQLIVLCVLFSGCGKESAIITSCNNLMEQRKYEEASSILEKALRDNPKSVKLLRQRVLFFLKVEQPGYAIAAYRTLQDVNPKDTILYKALANKDPIIRVTAARALGPMKDPNALNPLIKASKDPEKSVRHAVVQALGDLKNKKAIPVLVDFLKDEDWSVRGEAAFALGKIGDAQAATSLFLIVNDPDSYVQKNVRNALEELATEENKQAYLNALSSNDFAIQTMAAIALTNIGHTEGLRVLLTQLDNPENKDLRDIIRALEKSKDPAALPGLRRIVNHPDLRVKIEAILALGIFQDKDSVPVLKTLSTDKEQNGNVRTACLIALNRITGGN